MANTIYSNKIAQEILARLTRDEEAKPGKIFQIQARFFMTEILKCFSDIGILDEAWNKKFDEVSSEEAYDRANKYLEPTMRMLVFADSLTNYISDHLTGMSIVASEEHPEIADDLRRDMDAKVIEVKQRCMEEKSNFADKLADAIGLPPENPRETVMTMIQNLMSPHKHCEECNFCIFSPSDKRDGCQTCEDRVNQNEHVLQ